MQPNQTLLAQAWQHYAKAEEFDQKRARFAAQGREAVVLRAVDRELDKAVALEAAAFADDAIAA